MIRKKQDQAETLGSETQTQSVKRQRKANQKTRSSKAKTHVALRASDRALRYAWSKLVRRRDRWVCQCCKTKYHYRRLHAHHLEAYEANPALRYKLDNGVTLCISCHTKFHKHYGYGNNTAKQFEEFKTIFKDLPMATKKAAPKPKPKAKKKGKQKFPEAKVATPQPMTIYNPLNPNYGSSSFLGPA